MKIFGKILIAGVTIAISAIAILAIVITVMQSGAGDENTVMTVNGEPVTVREFEMWSAGNRAKVFSYFNKTYGVTDYDCFWDKSFSGETPNDKLKKMTVESLIPVKIQLILIKKNKILVDIDYDSFLKNLETENERRTEALKNNEPIYGLKQYNERDYFDYVFSNAVQSLKEKLFDTGTEADDKYNQMIEDLVKKADVKMNAKIYRGEWTLEKP